MRRRMPQFSIQAFAKVLCDLQDVNYKGFFRQQFAIAFDAYLAILREIKARTDEALGRNHPNWRIQNSCACCCYKVRLSHHSSCVSHFSS